MAYKVNYNFQKAERDRAKAAKKEAKLREKQARAADRGDDQPAHEDGTDGVADAEAQPS